MNKNVFHFIIGIVLLFSNMCLAQNDAITIQLLDSSTKEPIDGAIYHYNSGYGISDYQGKINLVLTERDSLHLSHISYGMWHLTADQLLDASKSGVIYKEQEVFNLQPVTVIALHPKSANVEQLDLNIHDKLSHDAGSILNQSPVVNSIRKSGGYGFDPVMRGFKYEQLNVVIDGSQSAIAACPNRMDPPTSQIAPNMMERVEILKGPYSFRYGSSFGGTINFKSNPVRFSNEQDFYGRFSGSSESNGEIYRSEGVFGISNNKYDIGLYGSWSKGNDYQDGDGNAYPAEFQRVSFGTNLGFHLAYNQQLILSVTHNIAGKTDFAALPMDLVSDKTSLFNIKHKMILQGEYLKSWNTTFYATIVDHKMDNLGKELNPQMMNAETDAKTYNLGGRTEGVWLFEKNKLFTGLDLKYEMAEGTRTREFLMGPMQGNIVLDNVWNGGQVSKTGLFAEYHHLFSTFKMVASARMEYNQARATDLNDAFNTKNPKINRDQINPNISIGGFKELNNNISLGLWYGYARRSASLTERYINSFPVGLDPYDMLGNPELDPEINNQFDLLATYKTGNTMVDINVFVSFLTDYISSEIDPVLNPIMPSSPGVRRYINISDAIMTGFEISWQQKLYAGIRHNMNVAFTYGQDEVLNEPLPEIAPLDFRYSLSGDYINNKLHPSFTYRYVIKQDRISETYGETITAAFSVVNLAMSYDVLNDVSVTLGVKNLFDEAYYEHLNRAVKGSNGAIYEPGRNIYFSIALDMM